MLWFLAIYSFFSKSSKIVVIFNINIKNKFKNNLKTISNTCMKHKKIMFDYVFALLDLNLILWICSTKWRQSVSLQNIISHKSHLEVVISLRLSQ